MHTYIYKRERERESEPLNIGDFNYCQGLGVFTMGKGLVLRLFGLNGSSWPQLELGGAEASTIYCILYLYIYIYIYIYKNDGYITCIYVVYSML